MRVFLCILRGRRADSRTAAQWSCHALLRCALHVYSFGRGSRARSASTASEGRTSSASTRTTASTIGISTPRRFASLPVWAALRTPSTACPIRTCASAGPWPAASRNPQRRFLDWSPVQVSTRSPRPESPARVSGRPPRARPRRDNSARPRVIRGSPCVGAEAETVCNARGNREHVLDCAADCDFPPRRRSDRRERRESGRAAQDDGRSRHRATQGSPRPADRPRPRMQRWDRRAVLRRPAERSPLATSNRKRPLVGCRPLVAHTRRTPGETTSLRRRTSSSKPSLGTAISASAPSDSAPIQGSGHLEGRRQLESRKIAVIAALAGDLVRPCRVARPEPHRPALAKQVQCERGAPGARSENRDRAASLGPPGPALPRLYERLRT